MTPPRAPALAAALLGVLPAHAATRAEAPYRVESVASSRVPAAVRVFVVTPPSYDTDPARRFPVLYFLHDGQGDEAVLLRKGVAEELLAEMRAGRMAEMLIVAPRGVGTWFVDSFDGRVRYASFLSDELVPFIDARYRTLPDRAARAATGISMGGYGALRWGLSRPDLFGTVGVLSPAVQQLSWRTVEAMPFFLRPALKRAFGPSETRNNLRASDLYDFLLSNPALAQRAPEVLVRCGSEDRYRLDQLTVFFRKFLDAVGVRNELTLEPGKHDWHYWRRAFPELARAVAARVAPRTAEARP